jgi:hypothetical protein
MANSRKYTYFPGTIGSISVTLVQTLLSLTLPTFTFFRPAKLTMNFLIDFIMNDDVVKSTPRAYMQNYHIGKWQDAEATGVADANDEPGATSPKLQHRAPR